MNVVVVPEEIGGDFSGRFELAVFPNDGLNLFYERVLSVVARDLMGAVLRVLKFPFLGKFDDPRRNCHCCVRSGLIESDF